MVDINKESRKLMLTKVFRGLYYLFINDSYILGMLLYFIHKV